MIDKSIIVIWLLVGSLSWSSQEETFDSARDFKSDCVDCGEPLFLTPLIKANKLEEARRAAYVNLTDRVPDVDSYSGVLTVDEKHHGNLFFWYFPVMNKRLEKVPLILWLQGGPGASSLFGLFREIGPYTVTENLTLEKKNISWAEDHSLLFIDNPFGAGFSFADEDGYATNQTIIGEYLYSALQQFMTLFPTLRRVPFVIAGESYAGKHVPSLAIQVHWNKNKDQPINLQGISIGNGLIDPITIQTSSRFFAEVGLLDDRTAKKVKKLEDESIKYIKKGNMIKAFEKSIMAKNLTLDTSGLPNRYNYLSDANWEGNYAKFLDKHDVRRALHVGAKTFNSYNMNVRQRLIPDFMNSAKSWLNELLDNYRVLLYNGHLDMMVPYHASVNTYNSLNFTGAAEYKDTERIAWEHNDIIAGYYKKAGNLLEVMVRGAGHMVPMDKPESALALISSFVRNIPLQSRNTPPFSN